jgi:hypothetical protein
MHVIPIGFLHRPKWVPPYALPTEINTSTLVGFNTAHSVRPATHDAGLWETALFGAWGGPTFVPKWGKAGAVVWTGTGGHSDPSHVDILLLDLEDGLYKYFVNANGVPQRSTAFGLAETTGAPYYEVLGATAGEMPAPGHAYATMVSSDNGDKGSVMYVTRGAITSDTPSYVSSAVHRMDLATRLWTRVTGVGSYASYEGSVAHDPTMNRWYVAGPDIGARRFMQYLRESDMSWQVTPEYPWPSQPGADLGRLMICDEKRMALFHRTGSLQGLDLTDDSTIAEGWVTLPLSGTSPASGNRWEWMPEAGKFFCKTSNTGNVLSTLTPPAGDGMTNPWTFDTVTVAGSGLPDRTIVNMHQTCLFRVPAYPGTLGWSSGPGQLAIAKVA